ncbi:MAG: CoA pyrophosphatase [Saprospiraceae bacterium]|nr:CoA pyrophosphatase [Saprospiraceae bacterium]
MGNNTFINHVRERLERPLPGIEAQLKMTFAWRAEQLKLNPDPPADAKTACVLMMLWQKESDWHTVLIQRTQNPRDRHSGQVSFPGGRHEKNDGALSETALREAEEEVGISKNQVEIIGRLTQLYIPVSNFVVHPFVGVLHDASDFNAQPGEVDAIYTPSVKHFQQPQNKTTKELVVGTGALLNDVPCYLVDEKAVWGATAMIISEFLEAIN